jgi:2-polyprenyl-3-methyl-5-hydroxy-6-metoxy-1,4-benzoquinol methylase
MKLLTFYSYLQLVVPWYGSCRVCFVRSNSVDVCLSRATRGCLLDDDDLHIFVSSFLPSSCTDSILALSFPPTSTSITFKFDCWENFCIYGFGLASWFIFLCHETHPSSKMVAEKDKEEEEVVEEAWTNSDGRNVFDESFQKLEVSKIDNVFSNKESNSIVFESYAMQEMTPLDMTYEDAEKNKDEFYDGTGSLVWLASIAFCHMVAQEKIPQLKTNNGEYEEEQPQQRICEVGCGVGLASIATLMAASHNANRMVVLTDNDQEALDISRRNCVLNSLAPNSYHQQLLSWGTRLVGGGNEILKEASFDIVLATDVIYDISMIPPLLQTASELLKWNGYLIVSHVPRFCLPKDERETTPTTNTLSCSSPQQELEAFIEQQAKLMALRLIDTIRPHQVLKNIPLTIHEERGECKLSLQRLKDAHAVLFIFEKC